MFQHRLLAGQDIEPLIEACCLVLEKVGVLCQNLELLEALERFGCQVDRQLERARFPSQLVREFIDDVRVGEGQAPSELDFMPSGKPGFGTQIAQIYYDYATGERRNGNRADQVACIKLGDVLHGESGVGHCLVQTEVPARLESLESALVLAEYAHCPHPPFAWYVEQIDYLIEMGEIMGWEHWFTYGATCFAHPLRFDKDVADKFVRRVKEGGPAGFTAMPVAGMSTPVTVEGFTAVAAAEIIAVWLAGRALNPGCALGGCMWSATVDMKSGAVSYSSFDALYYGFVCCEFLRLWTGREIPVGGGEYCDAKEPGLYAALEKAWKAMTIAAFQGRHPSVGQGMLECGRTLCPVQLLVEHDMALGTRQFARTPILDPGRIDLEGIIDVDLGLTQNHLGRPRTLAHFRELWLPEFVNRKGWAGAAGDRELLDRAQGRIDELLDEYSKPEGRDDKLAAMRAVVERARRRLVS